MTVKMRIKRMASNLMSSCGFHSIAERVYCSDRAFVLMYHRILPSGNDQPFFVQPGMFVSTASFERQVAFLKDRFRVVFLEELVDKILNGVEISEHCAITFDDGWRDNYTDAFPVLEKYGVPATIFLTTGFVGTDRMFWPEELCCYFNRDVVFSSAPQGAPQSLVRFNVEMGRYGRDRDTLLDGAIGLLKRFSPEEREEILGYFRSLSDSGPIPRQMLSWEEAGEMFASGLIRFGSHTVNHEILNQVPPEKTREEISLSRMEMERRLGCAVRTFAYPNGNFTEGIRDILSENGFDAAVTTRKGFLAPGMPLMEIPRIAIHEDVSNTIPMFRSRILFRKF